MPRARVEGTDSIIFKLEHVPFTWEDEGCKWVMEMREIGLTGCSK